MGAGFSKDAARRLAQAAKFVEQQPRNKLERAKGAAPAAVKKYAIVVAQITAAAGNVLGQGTATLQVVSVSSTGVATYGATSYAPVTVYSGASSAIAVGRLIQVCQIDGRWNVDVDYC